MFFCESRLTFLLMGICTSKKKTMKFDNDDDDYGQWSHKHTGERLLLEMTVKKKMKFIEIEWLRKQFRWPIWFFLVLDESYTIKKKVFFFIHLFKYSLICALAFCRYQSMILVVWYFSTRLPPSPQKIRNLDKNHHSLFYQWSWVFGIITVDSHHHLGYRDFMLTTDDKKNY